MIFAELAEDQTTDPGAFFFQELGPSELDSSQSQLAKTFIEHPKMQRNMPSQ